MGPEGGAAMVRWQCLLGMSRAVVTWVLKRDFSHVVSAVLMVKWPWPFQIWDEYKLLQLSWLSTQSDLALIEEARLPEGSKSGNGLPKAAGASRAKRGRLAVNLPRDRLLLFSSTNNFRAPLLPTKTSGSCPRTPLKAITHLGHRDLLYYAPTSICTDWRIELELVPSGTSGLPFLRRLTPACASNARTSTAIWTNRYFSCSETR